MGGLSFAPLGWKGRTGESDRRSVASLAALELLYGFLPIR